MLRDKSVRAKEEGVGLRDKMLGNPDLLGKSAAAAAARQLGMPQQLQRALMEKLLGIHRDKQLPEFAERDLRQVAAR